MSNQSRGLYYSILLMIGAPFLLLGTASFVIWKGLKNSSSAGTPEPAHDSPSPDGEVNSK